MKYQCTRMRKRNIEYVCVYVYCIYTFACVEEMAAGSNDIIYSVCICSSRLAICVVFYDNYKYGHKALCLKQLGFLKLFSFSPVTALMVYSSVFWKFFCFLILSIIYKNFINTQSKLDFPLGNKTF